MMPYQPQPEIEEQWNKELMGAGFAELEAVVLDSEQPFQLNAIMVARPDTGKKLLRPVTLLCRDVTSDPGFIVPELEKRGYAVHRGTLVDVPREGHDVIALLDREGAFFEDIDEARFENFKEYLDHMPDAAGLLWVTQPCQLHVRDPRYAQVLGTARSIRSELAIDIATCEVDNLDGSADLVVDVFARFQTRQDSDAAVAGLLKPDFEYSIHEREVNVGRYLPFSLAEELLASNEGDRVALETTMPGRLSALQWTSQEVRELREEEIEVETYTSGLNFRVGACSLHSPRFICPLIHLLEGCSLFEYSWRYK